MRAASERYKKALTEHMQGEAVIKMLQMDPRIAAEVPPGFMLGQRETEIGEGEDALLRRDSVTLGWPDDMDMQLVISDLGAEGEIVEINVNEEYYVCDDLRSDTIKKLCGTGSTKFVDFDRGFDGHVTLAMFTALCKFLHAAPVVDEDAPLTDRSGTAVPKIALMLLVCFVLDTYVYHIQRLPCVTEVPRA